MRKQRKKNLNKTKRVSLFKIIKDESIHARAETNDEIVRSLTETIGSGKELPPIVVFQEGDQYWIADGFYRYEAYLLMGRGTIPAIVFKGGRKEALIHALGANRDHGLRRSNKDKRKAVEIALLDVSLQGHSDNQIAEICNVSQPFVSKIRKLFTYNGYKFDAVRKCKNGRSMDTSNIGTKPETKPVTTQPEVPEIKNNDDEVTGPSDHEELEMNENQEPDPKEDAAAESEFEEAQSGGSANIETESGDEYQDLNLDESENAEDDLDSNDTADPEITEDESDPEHDGDTDTVNTDDDEDYLELDPEASGNEPKLDKDEKPEIEGPEATTGDYPGTSELDEIDPDALKLMVVHLQDTIKQQEAELKTKNNEIDDLEQLVEKLEDENIYLKKQLKGFAAAGINVSASLGINEMDEEDALVGA